VFDAADRNDDPGRPIVQLVPNFINGFIEQVGFDHDLKVLAVFRDEDGVACCLQVALQKEAAHVTIPEIGPPFQKWHILFAHGRLPKRAVGGVLKGPHHAGDITEGGAFQFALAERSRRFTFEVQNDKVFSCIKQLTKMIVAVNPDLRGIGASIE